MKRRRSSSPARRVLSIISAGALALTGAVVVPLSAPAPAQAAYPDTFNPFAMSGGFTVYAREDLTLGNQETEGSLAAGGVATHIGAAQYAIIHVAAGTADYTIPTVDGDPTRFLVGSYDDASEGILAITNAGTSEPSLLGDLKMVDRDGPWQTMARGDWIRLNLDASSPDETPIIDATAQTYPDAGDPPSGATGNGSIYTANTSPTAVADYVEANAEASYEDASQCLADLPTSGYPVGVAENAGERVVLDPLSADRVNIVDYADIAGAQLIQFSPGPTPGTQNPLIIRVPAGTTEVIGARIDPQGAYSPYTLWDLSQVTGDVLVNADGVRMDGSIYAPDANVTIDAAPLDGQVLGNNVVLQGGEVHSFLFAGEISCGSASHGTFTVEKALDGVDAQDLPPGTTFTVNYTATAPDGTVTTGSLEMPADGAAIDAGVDFPVGTVITFEEIVPASVPGYDWDDITITPSQITVGAETAEITVTNTATPQVVTGTFSVAKTVDVLGSDDVPVVAGSVTVNWAAFNGGSQIGSGSLTVPLDGTPVEVGQQFPEGTRIVLTEDRSTLPEPPDGNRWVSTAWDPGRVITIGADETVSVGLTNTLAPDTAARTISIVKSTIGAEPDAGYGYMVSYNTDPAPDRTDLALPVGETELITDLETDATTIDLAEYVPTIDGEPTDASDWEDPLFVVTVDGERTEYGPVAFEEIVPIPVQPDDQDISIEVVNELKQGTFTISKAFTGIDASRVPSGIGFNVEWTAETPAGEVSTGVMRVPANGTAVSPLDANGDPITFPYGTVIQYEELTPPAQNWLEWGTPSFSPADLTIGADGESTVATTLTNTVALRSGGFTVRKALEGIDADELLVDAFTIEYAARLPFGGTETGTFTIPADGTPAGPVDDGGDPVQFPIGTVIQLTEITSAESALPADYDWASTTWSPSRFILIGADQTAEVEVTNTVVELARFSVQKTVVGDAAGLVPADTVFPVEWWNGTERQDPDLEARIGTPDVSPYLPVGSIVELREGDLPVIDGVTWGAVTWSVEGGGISVTPQGLVVMQLDGGDAPDPISLTLTNAANTGPEPTPGPTPEPDDGALPATGGTAVPPIVVLGALLLIAAGFVLATTRRRA